MSELFVKVDEPAAAERGTIVIVHGLGEHSGRYDHVAEPLRAMGWKVVRYDHRGHGRSPGARGAIPHPTALLDDLTGILRLAAADEPRRLLLLGHSMGGTIVARFVAEERWPVDGAVLSSPALGAKLSLFNRVRLAVFSRIAPNLPVSNGLPATWLSHDASVVDAYKNDPLVHERITPRLARFILDSGPIILAAAPRWHVPTLLVWAGADRIVSPAGSAAFAAAAPPDVVRSREFPALYHEIFNEAEPARSEVLAALYGWLNG